MLHIACQKLDVFTCTKARDFVSEYYELLSLVFPFISTTNEMLMF